MMSVVFEVENSLYEVLSILALIVGYGFTLVCCELKENKDPTRRSNAAVREGLSPCPQVSEEKRKRVTRATDFEGRLSWRRRNSVVVGGIFPGKSS